MSATPEGPSAEDLAPHQSPFCFASAARAPGFTMPLPALDDEDGPRLPASLSPVVGAHVHIFPDRLFDAIWRWFDAYGWPIRHRLYSSDVVASSTALATDARQVRSIPTADLESHGRRGRPGLADPLVRLHDP